MTSCRNRQSSFPLSLHTSMRSSQLPYETVALSYVYGIMYYLIVLKSLLGLDLFTFSVAIMMIYRLSSEGV